MRIFIYKDWTNYIFDYKRRIFPVVKMLFICRCTGIAEADALFESVLGRSPKHPMIGCAPMPENVGFAELSREFNEREVQIESMKQSIRTLDYRIYGLEHPEIIPRPDFEI